MFFYGAEHLPAGILSITVTLVPMLTYAIGYLIGQEVFSVNRLIEVMLGIISIFIIVLPNTKYLHDVRFHNGKLQTHNVNFV